MSNRFRKTYRTILMFADKMSRTMCMFAKNGKNYINFWPKYLVTLLLSLFLLLLLLLYTCWRTYIHKQHVISVQHVYQCILFKINNQGAKARFKYQGQTQNLLQIGLLPKTRIQPVLRASLPIYRRHTIKQQHLAFAIHARIMCMILCNTEHIR